MQTRPGGASGTRTDIYTEKDALTFDRVPRGLSARMCPMCPAILVNKPFISKMHRMG